MGRASETEADAAHLKRTAFYENHFGRIGVFLLEGFECGLVTQIFFQTDNEAPGRSGKAGCRLRAMLILVVPDELQHFPDAVGKVGRNALFKRVFDVNYGAVKEGVFDKREPSRYRYLPKAS